MRGIHRSTVSSPHKGQLPLWTWLFVIQIRWKIGFIVISFFCNHATTKFNVSHTMAAVLRCRGMCTISSDQNIRIWMRREFSIEFEIRRKTAILVLFHSSIFRRHAHRTSHPWVKLRHVWLRGWNTCWLWPWRHQHHVHQANHCNGAPGETNGDGLYAHEHVHVRIYCYRICLPRYVITVIKKCITVI